MSARILVVEDNPTNLDLMRYVLRAFGYDVSYATDGPSGLDEAKTGRYDLVLVDILMPGMDGYEFARRFKSHASLPKTPLIAVTALAMAGDREKILGSGFDGYIPKPIEPQKFREQIESFLKRSPDGDSSRH